MLGKILVQVGVCLTIFLSLCSSIWAKEPKGVWKIAVLMVDFSDFPGKKEPGFYQDLLFGDHPAVAPEGSLKNYYREVSYGQLTLTGQVNNGKIRWYRMPHPVTHPPYNDERAHQLLIDAVDAAKRSGFDFGPFDTDNDGFVDAIIIIRTSGGLADFASGAGIDTGATNSLGNPVFTGNYMVISDGQKNTVIAHEFGHVLGLPDLYDRDLSSLGLGPWSMMSSILSPTHLDAWSKIRLGWVKPVVIDRPTALVLPPVEINPTVYKIPVPDREEEEYFLLENRQKIGFDANIPESGLLIYHVNGVSGNNNNEWYPGCGCSGRYLVALEQADGLWELEKNIRSGNDGDPYPGSTDNTIFNDTSTPDSRSNRGTSTGISIINIRQSEGNILADIEIPLAPDLVVKEITGPLAAEAGGSVLVLETVLNRGTSSAGGFRVGIYLSAGPGLTVSSSSTFLGSRSVSGLAAGESSSGSTLVTIPGNVPPGGYLISALADDEGLIAEKNEMNNGSGVDIMVTQNSGRTSDLFITQTDSPDPVSIGGQLTYTLTVINQGPDTAVGVSLSDTLPEGVTWVSSSSSQGSCNGTRTITCGLGDMNSGASATATITVMPTVTGAAGNTASVVSTVSDPNPNNNRATAETAVLGPPPQPGADLGLSMTDSPDPVVASQSLTYTLSVTNSGPSTATGVIVSDTLPNGAAFVSATSSQGSCAEAGNVTCNLGSIDPNATASVTIVVTPQLPGSLSNTANVTSETPDPNTANNGVTENTTIEPKPGDGGGCSIGAGGDFDPTLVGILGSIFLYFGWRRIRRKFALRNGPSIKTKSSWS